MFQVRILAREPIFLHAIELPSRSWMVPSNEAEIAVTVSNRDQVALIVLAAGAGTRMKSSLSKPLHPVAGRPMLWHVLEAGAAISPAARVVVLSPSIAAETAWVSSGFTVDVAIQDPPLGTADAVSSALALVPAEVRWLLVLFADHPLLTGTTVKRLVSHAAGSKSLVTILTCSLPDAGGYARIERDDRKRVTRIVERKDDDDAKRSGVIEINSGMMVIDAIWAREALPRIAPSPVTGEYYLPELVRMAVAERTSDDPWPVTAVHGDPEDLLGVNDRLELAHADAVLRDRIRTEHMRNGVTLILPETISIEQGVEIGEDTTIQPFTVIERGTRIGQGCTIGPHAFLRGATIGDGVTIRASTVIDSLMATSTDVGPYAHLRGGTSIASGTHIGSYAELKNAKVAESVRIGHFSYIGDAGVGARTNIGAGTVTCNFDGVNKHYTNIGDDVFIGSDTMLVAPVTIGDRASTGAGAVVRGDVEPGTTVVGVPAKPIQRKSVQSTERNTGGDVG